MMPEGDMGILRRTERSVVIAMCGVLLNDRKGSTDLIFMLGLKETIDQLAMVSSVCWYDHILRREDGHILRKALYFEVVVQRRKGRPKSTLEMQVELESMKVGLRRKDALCRSKLSVGVDKIAAVLR